MASTRTGAWLLGLLVFAASVAAAVVAMASRPSAQAGGGTDFTLSIDCDTGTPGVQLNCPAVAGAQPVDLVFTNTTGASAAVASFQLDIFGESTAALAVPNPPTTTTTFMAS